MKRCPECRRDYYDETLSFCLDDGSSLLEGPGSGSVSMDEPATAMLHRTDAAGEAATFGQIHTTDRTAVLPNIIDPPAAVTSSTGNFLVAGVLGAILVICLGVGGYWLYGRGGTKQIESIAVMPFVNESGNADVEYLSDGMTETLIKSLTGLPGLDVKPRSSVFRYKGKDTDLQTIGKELNVQAVLNGRVAQRADQLTLSLELVDVQKNSVIWSEQYQRKQSDIVSLQSEIARDVSSKLKSKLSGIEEAKVTTAATTDPDAYQAYLKGRFYWNRRTADNIKKAIEQFKAATEHDPNYALAYVGLGDCYAVLGEYAGTPTSETAPRAREFAERAIALDDRLAEPHATLGIVHEQLWQWNESEREYQKAIDLNPNYATAYHWYSIFLKVTGRFDEAAVAIKKAKELDPLSNVISINITRLYQLQNNHDAAIENTLRIIELDPRFSPAYEYIGLSYLTKGQNAEAIAALEKGVETSNRASVALCDLGYGYAVTGQRTEATAIIKELEDKYEKKQGTGRYIAGVYAGLGDKDRAFEWLEKDFQARNGELGNIKWAIPYDSLRSDPRFKDLMRRMNLPE